MLSLSKHKFFGDCFVYDVTTNLNCSYNLLLDVSSIIKQWDFCEYVSLKKMKTDDFNKSAFADRKLTVIM